MYPAVIVRAMAASPLVVRNSSRLISILNKGAGLAHKTLAEVWDWAKRDKANALLVVSSVGAMGLSIKEIFTTDESKKALKELSGPEVEQMVIEHGRGALMGAEISEKTRDLIEAQSDLTIGNDDDAFNHDELVDIMLAPRAMLGGHATPEAIVKFHDRLRAFIELKGSRVAYAATLQPRKV